MVATISDRSDVPVLALFERNAWLSGFDVPTLLVWADGTVLYSDPPSWRRQGDPRFFTARPQDADSVVREAVRQLRDAPVDSSVSEATDQPSVQIIFRDGEAARSVRVYGLHRGVGLAEMPDPLRGVWGAYNHLLGWQPHAGETAPTGYPRPPRWPDDLPTYRGQLVIDQLARCAPNSW